MVVGMLVSKDYGGFFYLFKGIVDIVYMLLNVFGYVSVDFVDFVVIVKCYFLEMYLYVLLEVVMQVVVV